MDLTDPVRPHSFQTHDCTRDMYPIRYIYILYSIIHRGIKLTLVSTYLAALAKSKILD